MSPLHTLTTKECESCGLVLSHCSNRRINLSMFTCVRLFILLRTMLKTGLKRFHSRVSSLEVWACQPCTTSCPHGPQVTLTCVILALICFVGCQSLTQQAPSFQLALPQAETMVSSLHEMTLSRKKRSFTFLLHQEMDNRHWRVVATTGMGARLFSVTSDGTSIRYDPAPLFDIPLPSAWLIADLQVLFWPLQNLHPQDHNVRLEHSLNTRRLLRKERELVKVHYENVDAWTGRATLQNIRGKYKLTIRPLL